jgi:hypothetical protein
MSNEPKEQELGEWRENPFLHPDVRKHVQKLKNDLLGAKLFNAIEGRKLEWIAETYPDIIKQYDAIRELEKAEQSAWADANTEPFFGEIK